MGGKSVCDLESPPDVDLVGEWGVLVKHGGNGLAVPALPSRDVVVVDESAGASRARTRESGNVSESLSQRGECMRQHKAVGRAEAMAGPAPERCAALAQFRATRTGTTDIVDTFHPAARVASDRADATDSGRFLDLQFFPAAKARKGGILETMQRC